MNRSRYVDPKDCASCGLCCTSFQIGYSKTEDTHLLDEIERFKLLDTDRIKVHEDASGYWVEFLFPCKHAKMNEKGHYCAIYDGKRPQMCADYPHANTVECPHLKKQRAIVNHPAEKP